MLPSITISLILKLTGTTKNTSIALEKPSIRLSNLSTEARGRKSSSMPEWKLMTKSLRPESDRLTSETLYRPSDYSMTPILNSNLKLALNSLRLYEANPKSTRLTPSLRNMLNPSLPNLLQRLTINSFRLTARIKDKRLLTPYRIFGLYKLIKITPKDSAFLANSKKKKRNLLLDSSLTMKHSLKMKYVTKLETELLTLQEELLSSEAFRLKNRKK